MRQANQEVNFDPVYRCHLFRDLTKPEIDDILDCCMQMSVVPGEFVFHEADAGDSLFIVAAGSVRVFHEETCQSLAEIPVGEIFGEMALFSQDEGRAASALAIEPTTLLTISYEDCIHNKHGAKILFNIGSIVADRLKKLTAALSAAGVSIYPGR